MSSTLLAIRSIARKALRSGQPPDFSQLDRLLLYVERYPQRLHQPAEEHHLFRAIAQREPGAARPIARAKRDHAACTGYVNRLRDALNRWRRGQSSAGGEVALFADDYVRFCRLHARIEERDLLSIATRVLTPDDWRAVELAFAGAGDPLDRSNGRNDCEAALRTLA